MKLVLASEKGQLLELFLRELRVIAMDKTIKITNCEYCISMKSLLCPSRYLLSFYHNLCLSLDTISASFIWRLNLLQS